MPRVATPVPAPTQAAPVFANVIAQQPFPGPHGHHQAIAQAQAAQMILQSQLNMLQQQLAMHRQRENGVATHGTTLHHNHAQTMPVPHGFIPVPANMPSFQAILAHQQQIRAQTGFANSQNPAHTSENTPPLQGGRSHEGAHDQAHQQAIRQAQQLAQVNSPDIHVSYGPTTTTVHEGVGPYGSRMRVVVNEPVDFHGPRQGTPTAGATMNRPLSVSSSQAPHATTLNPSMPGQPGTRLPQLGFSLPPLIPDSNLLSIAPIPGQQNTSPASSTLTANTTAWLLSTPTGPQAIVFAPGHGYFSSVSALIPTRTTAQLTSSPRSTLHGRPISRQSSTGRLRHRHPRDQANPAPPANAAPARVVARPAGQDQANGDNDLFHLIFQRGWLFLRLYIFMFVLSEPGTWRRCFLLAVAVIVCLLPRDNPLRDLTNRIRAHIEGLVPVAAAPGGRQRDQQVQNGDGHARDAAPARSGSPVVAGQITAEQAAAGILQQNHNPLLGNNGIFRDTIYRIERAVALFLASLVPGVGERHVRAREDARREADEDVRREAERVQNARLEEGSAPGLEVAANNGISATGENPDQGAHGVVERSTSVTKSTESDMKASDTPVRERADPAGPSEPTSSAVDQR